MNKLIIDKKFLRLKDSFTVRTQTNQHLYTVAIENLKNPREFLVTDQINQEVAKIFLTWEKRLIIGNLIINGEKVCTMRRLRKQSKQNRFIIEALDIEILTTGSNFSFNVFAKGEKIAVIKKKWMTAFDTFHLRYLLPHFDKKMQLILIFIGIVIAKANLPFFANIFDVFS